MLNPIYSLSLLLLMFVDIKAFNPFSNEANVQEDYYVVFMNNNPRKEESALRQMHMDVLSIVKGSEIDAKESLVYSYTKSFNGFAAKLSQNEVNKLSEMDDVLNVIKSGKRKLHTTRSWDFLGLPVGAKRNLKFESDVIVGLLDTGIRPESKSFVDDDGLGPIPKKWKGTCGPYANFSCNKKLIGARYYISNDDIYSNEILSPLDTEGHGTHTSSTAVGALVNHANLSGLATGTSRGAAPSARVAMYKVCGAIGCEEMGIAKAIDDAIHDGVDILSLSLGGASPKYNEDILGIGLFHAMKKGILPVLSAGNDGYEGSVSNHAPWMLTVAASTIDRQFTSTLELGNGLKFMAANLNLCNTTRKSPITVGRRDAVKNNFGIQEASLCSELFDSKMVKGKIVLCKPEATVYDADEIRKLGGVGIVLQVDDSLVFEQAVYAWSIPLTFVNSTASTTIIDYITSTKSPTGIIHKSEQVNKDPAPVMASFSSRGPHSLSHNLLKPDISAPGVNILASYTNLSSVSESILYPQYSDFTIMSGTSMSCPHVSGLAAYVKSFHRDWSQAAIKSAIMTTATPMSRKGNKGAEFGYGVGQVNPTGALNPGLIYDMNEHSYLQFLCHEGIYSDKDIRTISGDKSLKCSSIKQGRGSDAINYPTMQLHVKKGQKLPSTSVFYRTVTNVGPAQSVYEAIVRAPKGVEISVEPNKLSFTRKKENKEFKVMVKVNTISNNSDNLVSGSLTWKNSKYSVRSVIVVSFSQIPE